MRQKSGVFARLASQEKRIAFMGMSSPKKTLVETNMDTGAVGFAQKKQVIEIGKRTEQSTTKTGDLHDIQRMVLQRTASGTVHQKSSYIFCC
jgi:hypothetical protein